MSEDVCPKNEYIVYENPDQNPNYAPANEKTENFHMNRITLIITAPRHRNTRGNNTKSLEKSKALQRIFTVLLV